MSAASETTHESHTSESYLHGSEHGNADLPHATLKGYLTGFGLSVILTVIPFWLVMGHVFSNTTTTILLVLAIGVVQIFVHMVYFLHMNSTSEAGWNLMALIFTLILVVIALSGSIWIMYHENANMMPEMPASTSMPMSMPMPPQHSHDMN
ncbi:MAG: cytochrome o ubiquinol oxidase subunit IV [Stenotrophobium sp.]